MTLLEAMRFRPRVKTVDFRNTEELDAAADAIKIAFPGYDQSPNLTIDELLSMLGEKVDSWAWEGIKVGDIAVIVRAVFSETVAASTAVRKFLEREILATTNTAILQAVCETYLAIWARSKPKTTWLAQAIENRAQHLSMSWRRCFLTHPELLDPDTAPEQMAAKMADQRDPFHWLIAGGIAAPHSGQLMRELHFAWLKAIPEPKSANDIEQIFSWVFPVGYPILDGELAASAVEKLLNPWSSVQPDGNIRKLLLNRIVETYGDPRNQRAEFWALVAEPTKKVLVRWLAGASMDALLSIITNSTDNNMWPPRHSFWKGLYDRGLIDEAWVALSPAAHDNGTSMFQTTKNPIYAMAGKQIAKSRKDTCLLIMRIGRFTVVEGSHDYRVHVFQSSDPAAPLFYQEEYDAEKMTLPKFHWNTRIHDQPGHWMKWVEQSVLRS